MSWGENRGQEQTLVWTLRQTQGSSRTKTGLGHTGGRRDGPFPGGTRWTTGSPRSRDLSPGQVTWKFRAKSLPWGPFTGRDTGPDSARVPWVLSSALVGQWEGERCPGSVLCVKRREGGGLWRCLTPSSLGRGTCTYASCPASKGLSAGRPFPHAGPPPEPGAPKESGQLPSSPRAGAGGGGAQVFSPSSVEQPSPSG